MTGSTRVAIALMACAGLALAAPAYAQQDQQNLSEQEVKQFLDSAEQDVVEAVKAGEWQRVLEWTRDTIADGATFFVSEEIFVGDERKAFSVASLDKDDMVKLGGIAVGVMSNMPGQPIRNYSLDIEATKVTPIGPDAATVETKMTESGEFAISQGQTEAGAPADGQTQDEQGEDTQAEAGGTQAGKTMSISATATCTHVIQRGDDGGQLKIGMSNCQVRAKL